MNDDKVIIVAELGINHNGDVDLARKMINAAKAAGCDYVKFQKRTVDVVYTEEELDKPRESPFGSTNRQQKEGLEFDKDDYNNLDRYCKAMGIPWFASPWDCDSVDFLMQYDTPFIKVASACVTNFKVLQTIAKTSKDIILSTGMSTHDEIRNALNFLGWQTKYLLACTSTYPTANNEMNLNFITTLKQEFSFQQIGFSNHHPGVFFAACSALLGARMVEFHLTLDRSMYGSDQVASLEPEGVTKLVKYIRGLEQAMGDGGWKVFESEKAIRDKLRKKQK